MKYTILITSLFFLLGICFFYNTRRIMHTSVDETKKYHIVCTTMILADAVKNITPMENFSVHALMGPGVDPHTYKARPSDMQLLLDADLIIYNGLHLEGKMGELLKEFEQKKVVFCATDALEKNQLINVGYENMYDPHVWHDIQLWQIVITAIYQKLSLLFPKFETILRMLYDEYKIILNDTATALDALIKKIPEERRILITAHDAFHYFGIRYNFTVFGLQGLSTESEIGIRDIHTLANLIVTKKVKAIFPESCIPPRNILALQEVVTQKGSLVTTGGELFSDSLSTSSGNAPTYITMLFHNIATIVSALEEE